ncbi:hypothetical protein L6654_26765 [Bradyrhizobium sp. WYCCWR 13023]|uniref:Uncharacterized protein n=1 Tax=Bradyrhizobium zhengyangense TaxID=2911009 RepID=A0A9X1RE25_9BRAD|nr:MULTISPECIES: hypothetical protein [Bradyrhizobium]MCG2630236.1 hypothetical protein [Bradyrhizobium zhengyangense]MCG2637763.1 hypothetical protein [Bradyrhizobium zhengyangense]MCG2666161.1 hypothetical protein [Bradyrhizobium zhengyangense]MDA9521040.1 hypothetical protein [Bradyrhizobium sp. CCBAU 11434]
MTTEDIERAIEQLTPRELAQFRAWFEQFDAHRFDQALEQDAKAGKLDAFAEEALSAYRAGQTRDL